MKIPDAFNHKPVIVADHYDQIDGRYAGRSDAKCLSLGITPGSDNRRSELSAQVWRSTGDTLSAQSEELPLHRALDLAILICRSLEHFNEAYIYEHLYDPEQPVLDRIGLQGSAMNVAICTDNANIREDIQTFNQAISDNGEMIGERLRTLSRVLKELGY
ncbi:hypothetical protein FHS18_006606 [Paenibacillus phyllosphaerae]|uniref:Uncharacterized protein n=1 Tax=Paenibacillus phyllosphaerae TaxID=274593 RepID=A0A7W5B4X4_9BACL|nr:DUF6530 family protein [Paenibacillus phyllosphaerae]MBB3114485.1 hypothetical protein [Paenibacillus phyllosphaerae]